ncbi:TPA: phage tail protein [Bacillus cereus]|nr:phage tail protein [Bacillus cereus]
MRKPSGQLHVVDHSTEQIVAVLQPNDYRDDLRHWEIKNNIDRLEFKVFTSLPAAATLMQQNLILRETRDGRIIPYTIDEAIQTTDNRSIHVYASAVWVEIAQANYIRPQKIQSKTVNEFMDMALAGTKWERGFTEYSGFHTMTIDTFIDPLKFLKDIASLFHLEIQYRVEVLGSQIVGWYVDMIQRRGKDEGKEITLGKDLIGIKRIENTRNICTALVGFVKGEGDSVITIESINKGLPYIVDTQAFQLWNKRGFHRFGLYTPETENQNMTPQRLKTLMEIEIKKRRNAAVTYEVEAQSINRVFEFDHESIFEGDTIRIKDKGFKPKLYLEARAIAGDESYKNPLQDRYMFGDYREIVDPNEELRKLYNKILGSLGDKANKETLEQLEKLAKEARETANNSKQTADNASEAAKIAKDIADAVLIKQKDFQTKIIKSTTPPSNPIKDLTLWLDISNPEKPILYLWNGTKWDRLTPDTSVIDADIKGIEDEIKKLQTEVGSKVNQQWVKEQIQTDIKNKADIKDVYKKTEIDKALEGHVKVQSYEIDKKALKDDIASNANAININNKNYIQRFTENETKITQTEKDIKTQIEQLSVTNKKVNSQGTTIDEVQKKTNEIVQDADGTKQTITSIQTELKNQLTTSRNVLINSNFIDSMDTWRTLWSKVEIRDMDNAMHPEFSKYARIEKVDANDTWLTKDLDVVPGEYIISAWVRSVDGSFATIGVKDNADGASGDPGVKYFFFNADETMNDGKWHHLYGKIKIDHGRVRVYFGLKKSSSTTGQKIDITGVKLANGNIVDNWTVAPEDLANNTEFKKKTAEIITRVDKVSSTLTETNKQVNTVETKADNANNAANTANNNAQNAQKTADNASNAANTANNNAQNAQKTADNANKEIITTNKRVSDVTQTVDRLQVNISDISKIQQGHTTELQQHNSKIDANAKAIQTKVDSQFVEEYTGGLGSTQLIRDAEFADGFKYWYKSNNANFTAEVDTTNLYNGSPSMRLQGVNQTANVSTNVTSATKIPVTPGEKITASLALFTKKLSEHVNPYLSCSIVCWDINNKQLTAMGWSTKVVDNVWTKTSHTVTVPDTAVRMELRVYVTKNGELWFSKPMLQRGEVASYFTLHPKDYTDYDKLVNDIASRVLTEDYNKKITEMNTMFTQTSKALELKAEAKNVYTKNEVDSRNDAVVETMNARFKVQANEISSKVEKGSIISSINQTAEKIKITADLIDLVGKVEASWLKAGLLIGMTIKTSNSTEHLHMENQVVRFVNQGSDKMVIGFENERKSKTRNPYIILGEGDGSGKNFGSIYKDGNGVYYRYVDLNGAESNVRLTAQGNVGISAQDGFWINSKRANFSSTIEVPAIRFTSLGTTPGSQQGNFWIGNGYKGFGIYYYDTYWKFVQGS